VEPSNDAGRSALLARIAREFSVVTDTLRVANREYVFTRVADPDRVLDEVCQAEEAQRTGVKSRRELRMPYWAAVWESAAAVGAHLIRRHPDLRGRNAMDLGCGTGAAGMVLADLGARVLLGDIDTAPLLFSALNTHPWRDRVRVRRLDWQTDRLDERFDLIVGSDVLYERGQWDSIEPFLRHHLAPGGFVLIGEPGRPKAVEFPAWMTSRGWTVDTTPADVAGYARPIQIHHLRRS
jgi:predicted nicotinamide N-methyase